MQVRMTSEKGDARVITIRDAWVIVAMVSDTPAAADRVRAAIVRGDAVDYRVLGRVVTFERVGSDHGQD